jgi:hypothetical protein
VIVTLFDRPWLPAGRRMTVASFDALARWLAEPLPPPPRTNLDALGGWSPATFKGSRCKENVQVVCALGIDLDTGDLSAERVRELYGAMRAVAHTTRRSAEASPRWRVVVALTRPVSASEYACVWHAEAERLTRSGIIADRSTKNADRYWFRPCRSATDGSFQTFETQGEALGVDAIVAAARREQEAARVRLCTAPRQGTAYARGALRRECDAVATAPAGMRNDRLNRAAFSLARFVATGELAELEVRENLAAAARIAGIKGSEVTKTIASGMRSGGPR